MSATQTTAAPKAARINGVDPNDVRALAAACAEKASNAQAGFHVRTRWTGAAKTETTVSHWTLAGKRLPRSFAIRTDEPPELCGESADANPQEVLMAGMNACITVGFVANCAVEGITLDSLEIETEGTLDLRGFLGLDPAIKPGYDELRYTLRVRADAPRATLEAIHQRVMATSPNFFNVANPVRIRPTLVVE